MFGVGIICVKFPFMHKRKKYFEELRNGDQVWGRRVDGNLILSMVSTNILAFYLCKSYSNHMRSFDKVYILRGTSEQPYGFSNRVKSTLEAS